MYGEGIEQNWAEMNCVANSTKEMGLGSWHDTLNNYFGHHNWQNLTGLGKPLVTLTTVRNHISVGVERAYLHELSIDHLHYGVALTLPCIACQRRMLSHAYAFSRLRLACVPTLYHLSSRRTDPWPNTPLVHHIPCCTSVTRTTAL
jgi:hypothetical protein